MSIRTVLAALTMVLVSVPMCAQDLLARQAPSDKRLKAMDSISLRRYLPGYGSGSIFGTSGAEFSKTNPSANLYPTWDNGHGRNFGTLPSEFKIDLRHFSMPCDSRLVTSHYGYRRQFRRFHYGTDIKVYVGDTIRSMFDGKIRIVDYDGRGYGRYVVIRHENGLETLYGHMSKHLVVENQVIRAGQPIGLGGNTGRSTGSHLHLETRFLGQFINPELMFNFEAQDAKGDYYVYRSNGGSSIGGTPRHADVTATSFAMLAPGQGDATNEMNATEAMNSQDDSRQAELARQEQANKQKDARKKQSSGSVHRVKQGDTLYGLALKYHTTVDKLCKINKISPTSTLRLGQILKCS